MLQIQMRILRVFGLSKAEMNSIIENAQAEGSPSLRLQERDGEYLVCVQASAPTQAMADEYCEKWVQKLRTRFGDACYGFEDTTLAQAALDALLKKAPPACCGGRSHRPPVGQRPARPAAQRSSVRFWQPDLPEPGERPPHCRAGSSAQKVPRRYGSGRCRPRSKRFAAGQCGLCRRVYARNSGAGAFVLLCSRIGAAACALSPEISDMAIANHILDLARRRALGMHLGPSAITFKPGRERPLLLVSGEGQPRPGLRFTLRRKAARPNRRLSPTPRTATMQNRSPITMRSPLNPNRRLPLPGPLPLTPHRPACRAAANTGSAGPAHRRPAGRRRSARPPRRRKRAGPGPGTVCHPHHQNFPCRFGAGHGGSAGSKAAGAAQPGTARCTAAGTPAGAGTARQPAETKSFYPG